ncbi:MAG: hypothetical protein S4CHLAM20_08630 [Chlamydiia bacterium]|nr:hypothetical protein [Chlamydiia bacterium]
MLFFEQTFYEEKRDKIDVVRDRINTYGGSIKWNLMLFFGRPMCPTNSRATEARDKRMIDSAEKIAAIQIQSLVRKFLTKLSRV